MSPQPGGAADRCGQGHTIGAILLVKWPTSQRLLITATARFFSRLLILVVNLIVSGPFNCDKF